MPRHASPQPYRKKRITSTEESTLPVYDNVIALREDPVPLNTNFIFASVRRNSVSAYHRIADVTSRISQSAKRTLADLIPQLRPTAVPVREPPHRRRRLNNGEAHEVTIVEPQLIPDTLDQTLLTSTISVCPPSNYNEEEKVTFLQQDDARKLLQRPPRLGAQIMSKEQEEQIRYPKEDGPIIQPSISNKPPVPTFKEGIQIDHARLAEEKMKEEERKRAEELKKVEEEKRFREKQEYDRQQEELKRKQEEMVRKQQYDALEQHRLAMEKQYVQYREDTERILAEKKAEQTTAQQETQKRLEVEQKFLLQRAEILQKREELLEQEKNNTMQRVVEVTQREIALQESERRQIMHQQVHDSDREIANTQAAIFADENEFSKKTRPPKIKAPTLPQSTKSKESQLAPHSIFGASALPSEPDMSPIGTSSSSTAVPEYDYNDDPMDCSSSFESYEIKGGKSNPFGNRGLQQNREKKIIFGSAHINANNNGNQQFGQQFDDNQQFGQQFDNNQQFEQQDNKPKQNPPGKIRFGPRAGQGSAETKNNNSQQNNIFGASDLVQGQGKKKKNKGKTDDTIQQDDQFGKGQNGKGGKKNNRGQHDMYGNQDDDTFDDGHQFNNNKGNSKVKVEKKIIGGNKIRMEIKMMILLMTVINLITIRVMVKVKVEKNKIENKICMEIKMMILLMTVINLIIKTIKVVVKIKVKKVEKIKKDKEKDMIIKGKEKEIDMMIIRMILYMIDKDNKIVR